jgi:hypothetical protein
VQARTLGVAYLKTFLDRSFILRIQYRYVKHVHAYGILDKSLYHHRNLLTYYEFTLFYSKNHLSLLICNV